MDFLTAIAKAFTDAAPRPLDTSGATDGYCGIHWEQVVPDFSVIGGKPPKEK